LAGKNIFLRLLCLFAANLNKPRTRTPAAKRRKKSQKEETRLTGFNARTQGRKDAVKHQAQNGAPCEDGAVLKIGH
jgi:hypothetical protein